MSTIKHTKNNSKRTFAILVGAIVFLIALNMLGWLPVADVGRDIARPISSPLTKLGQRAGGFLSEIGSLGTLNKANQNLEQQNAQLMKELAELRELKTENAELRKELNYSSKNQRTLVGADVIGYQPDSVRKLIQINRGANDGIKKGQVVIDEGNLVGRIYGVSARSASVLLVNDANFRAVVIDQKTRAPGIVAGQIGGSVNMERIPRDKTVNKGDIIITSGLGGEFPSGLIVGEVSSVKRPGESIFNVAQLKLPYEPSSLKLVRIITSN